MKRPDHRSGLLRSWSGLVTVFFRLRDRTSKHYFRTLASIAEIMTTGQRTAQTPTASMPVTTAPMNFGRSWTTSLRLRVLLCWAHRRMRTISFLFRLHQPNLNLKSLQPSPPPRWKKTLPAPPTPLVQPLLKPWRQIDASLKGKPS